MPRLDGAHTHGSSRWDWRYALPVALIGTCLVPAGRSFMFAGFLTAMLWIAGGVTAAVALLAVMVWRSWRRGRRDFAAGSARQDAEARILARAEVFRAAFDDRYPAMAIYPRDDGMNRAILSAQYGYPGPEGVSFEYSVHPELVRYGTITGRMPSEPESAGRGHTTWPVRRDNPGHE